ncbi:cation-translocating P-type ATPase [Rhodanobacter ginsengisoli]|uniref:Cation-translocating P-type ATPase n=1 Tax=Rhodanobacter ginsengisoli TaxID=418646 RepID=A0ABW0QKE9_9GAMM
MSSSEAAARLRRNGPNLLPRAQRTRWLGTLGNLLREPMLLLLLVAAAIYWLLGDPQEAAVLGVSILLVIAVTAYQELKSEHALQALRDLSSPRARVLRDGTTRLIAARELVTGDVIVLAEGDRIPADARMFGDGDLQVDESMLTGESVPVRHRSGAAMADSESEWLGASTLVVGGQGTAEVIATGADTTVGRIGAALRSIRKELSPMQREMRRVVATLALIGLASCALVVALYVSTRGHWLEGLLAGITLAISNVPEELPVVMTVFLALGAWRMARHQALVRRAPAIEALGAITVLCTDKTGTLTENHMAVTELALGAEAAPPGAGLSTALRRALECADLAGPQRSTDPMEQAIRTAARDSGVSGRHEREHVREYPLSDELLAKVEVWRSSELSALQIAGKGAPEAMADLCALEPATRAQTLARVDDMARRGLRVLAVAEATWPDADEALPASADGFQFTWRGLVGLADPLRDGVPEAIAEAREAGVRVVMLTGDHLQTACAVASSAGLGTRVSALGSELDALDDDELGRRAAGIDVFARVRPEHKLRLVRALKQAGDVVAMTGDGVNDAPALMAAHVGIAMGGRGTDVAREAASIVLLDDNFVTVVKAIRRGRTIHDNILRAVRFVLAVHVPITGLALLPLLTGAPLVLLPVHVVFLEMIVDPACSIVFEREPPEANVMRRPPRQPNRPLLDLATLLSGLAEGLIVLAAVVGIYAYGRHVDLPQAQLASMSFTAVVTGNLGLILLNRSGTSILGALQQPNAAFWLVSCAALGLLMIAIWVDMPARWFRFAPLPPGLMAIALLLPLLSVLCFDLLRRRFPLFRRGTSTDSS